MLAASQSPRLHLFVCANHRPEGSPLGPGCGDAGEALYARLKEEVARRSHVVDVWVTKTHCLGLCPPIGASVAVYPCGQILTEVAPSDARTLYARAIGEVPS
jgi:(2Fe-2S) ferredoxin